MFNCCLPGHLEIGCEQGEILLIGFWRRDEGGYAAEARVCTGHHAEKFLIPARWWWPFNIKPSEDRRGESRCLLFSTEHRTCVSERAGGAARGIGEPTVPLECPPAAIGWSTA